MSDEIQGSPPSRDYNTAKFKLSLTIFRNQGLRHEKYEEIKASIGRKICQSDTPVSNLRGAAKRVNFLVVGLLRGSEKNYDH